MNHMSALRATALSAASICIATVPPAHGDTLGLIGLHNLPLIQSSSPPPMPAGIPKTITTLSSCSGTQAADGASWRCTFDDEFNGSSLDRTVWTPQVNFPTGDSSNHACYVDDPRTISVNGGALHLSLVTIPSTNTIPCGALSAIPTPYITAQVSTYHTFSQEYGRFEARVKNVATSVPGLQEDYWMWPDDRYASSLPIDGVTSPDNGEIDVVELFSSEPNWAVPYLHYSYTDNTGAQPGINTADCPAQRGVWNTYDLIWNPQYVAIYVNGSLCLVNTSQDPAFNKPYITLFSMAMGTAASNDTFSSSTPVPASEDVDYARAWQYSN